MARFIVRWVVAPLAAAVVLAGCGSSADPAAEPEAGGTTSASPTEPTGSEPNGDQPSPSNGTAPPADSMPGSAAPSGGQQDASNQPGGEDGDDAGAPDGADSDSVIVGGPIASPAPLGVIEPCALGPLVVGMLADSAKATGLAEWEPSANGASGFIFKAGDGVFIAGSDTEGIIGFLVKSDQWQTPEGISPGSGSVASLRSAYGDQLQELTTPEGYPYYLVRDGDCGYFFAPDSFGPPDAPIMVIINGWWDAVSRARPNTSFG